MMKKAFKIADDIVKLIEGKITIQELDELDSWLDSSPKNRELLSSVLDNTSFEEEKNKYSDEYIHEKFEEVVRRKKRLRRSRALRRWSVVAACISGIFFASMVYILWQQNSGADMNTTAEILRPQKSASLLLSSGEQFFLEESQKDTLSSMHDSHQIIVNNGSVHVVGSKTDSVPEISYHTLTVPLHSDYSLELPDGSRVYLNAGSQLKFPSSFSDFERVVMLTGEAYFKVNRDEHKPFIVCTDAVRVKVLGTEFAVRNYSEGPVLTTLVKGKVEVKDSAGWSAVLKPGEQVCTENGSSRINEVETIYYTAWKDGYFMFSNTPLEEIMSELSKWYGCTCFFQNQEVAKLRISARLKKYDQIDSLLELLERTHEIQVEKKGNVIIIGKGLKQGGM